MICDRRTLMKMALLSGAASVLPGIGLLGGPAFGQGTDTTLRIGLSTYPTHLRPWANVGYAGQLVSTLINRNLLSYDESGQLVGELAESWEREGDRNWIIVLREASFSDGRPVTSADVKWTFDQIAVDGSGAYMRDPLLSIAQVEIVDERTVRLSTREPDVTIPALLAYPFFAIIAEGSTDEREEGVGAGPYVITASERGVGITLEASRHYFKEDLPRIARIQITPYVDESLRVTALAAGDVDLIDYVPWSAMDTIEADPNLTLDTQAAGAFMYLSFNGSGAFADARLRRAVAFALRREEFVDSVFFGRGAPLAGVPRPSVTPYFDEERANFWHYDPDQARALIRDAGHESGLTVNLLATSQYTMHRDIAVLVQSQLAEVGITVNLSLPDWATRVTMGNRGQGDFAVQGVGIDSLDPDAAATLIDPSLPPTFLRSRNFEVPGLSDLLARGRRESDEGRRVELYGEVDRLVYEHTPFCGLAYRATGFARSTRVSDLQLLPDQLSPFSATLFDRLSIA